ncbi:MAG TPA: hypothetical protein VN081_04195 [Dongiaceae bacterium]|nr:hypothetical protein [Dongiaceae bacterium]
MNAIELEPIVVKAVTNEDYFGEPGVIRAIVERFVPLVVDQPGRDVLFIHRKDPQAATSIAIEVHAAGSEAMRVLTLRTIERLMNLPKLAYAVRFTEVITTSPESFNTMVASLEAENSFRSFLGGIIAKLAAERRSAEDVERYNEGMWNRLYGLPVPWEMYLEPGSSQFAEADFIVGTLMGIVGEEFR